MGKQGLSKQALSLIERNQMKIPPLRLKALQNAYSLSALERKELSKLYAFEQLVENTGEDREFAEAMLSVIDPMKATSVYVVGGRDLSVNSRLLQEKAAEFLGNTTNRLVFLYPECMRKGDHCRTVWYANTRRESLLIRRSVEAFAKRPLRDQIQFHNIDVHNIDDESTLGILSLCSPVTSTTVATSMSSDYAAGYVYVEGPHDRWVLLKHAAAKRILNVIALWLDHEKNISAGETRAA
jgi:hypothetical protein